MTDHNTPIEALAGRAEQALSDTDSEPSMLSSLLAELRKAVAQNPETGARLGPLIGKVNRALQAARQSPVHWVSVLQGHLAIGHRPKVKTVQNMQWTNVTHVCTLLSESEGAKKIGTLVRKAGLEWIWMPLPSADPPGAEMTERITVTFDEMKDALQNDARIYVHCSAGIHRTGMITYGFLRYAGLSRDDARKTLAQLRTETAEGAGDERLQWGEQFG